jgi:hypothetical protein
VSRLREGKVFSIVHMRCMLCVSFCYTCKANPSHFGCQLSLPISVRLYDLRMLRRSGKGAKPNWVSCYVPQHMRTAGGPPGMPSGQCVTGISFNHNGTSLVASYARENIYSFDLVNHALGPDRFVPSLTMLLPCPSQLCQVAFWFKAAETIRGCLAFCSVMLLSRSPMLRRDREHPSWYGMLRPPMMRGSGR